MTARKCIDCFHWKPTGEENYPGYCALYSSICATAVFHHTTLTWFLSKKDVKPIEIKLKEGGNRVKGELMSSEEQVTALHSRQRQNPQYQDMRTLTEESKKALRKERRKKHVSETA